MINTREIIVLITSALVLGYLVAFKTFIDFSFSAWGIASLLALLMVIINTAGKKMVANHYMTNIEISHWHFQRYGWWRWMYLKRLFPIWFVLPLVLIWISNGFIKWFAILTFEATPMPGRARSQFGEKTIFSEVTEWDLALIALGGVLFNVILAFISHLMGFSDFARINIMFILFNLIPISSLDGSKVLFGSKFLWIFTVVLSIAMLFLLDIAGAIPMMVVALIIALAAVFFFYYLKLH